MTPYQDTVWFHESFGFDHVSAGMWGHVLCGMALDLGIQTAANEHARAALTAVTKWVGIDQVDFAVRIAERGLKGWGLDDCEREIGDSGGTCRRHEGHGGECWFWEPDES